MKNHTYKLFTTMSVLLMIVVLTSVFVLAVTFGGSPEEPDAIATYTKNKITWSVPCDEDGVGMLNIFGDPAEGEEYPTVHPFSDGKYYFRLKNDVTGRIGYQMYIYCENDPEHPLPLDFNVIGGESERFTVKDLPKDIRDKQVLHKVKGAIDGRNLKDFEFDWKWVTESDEADTALGNLAVHQDIIYTLNVLIIFEDNNAYNKGGNTFGFATANARMLHRHYVIGYPEGDFRQDGNTTRAETATIFARIHANYNEDNLTTVDNGFTDSPFDAWYAKYISRIEQTDLMQGYPDKSFRPDGAVTRAEFAAVCVRYYENHIGKIDKADISFDDIDSSHWSYEIIQKAVAQGYLQGYPDNTVKPDDFIRRCEVVTVVNRLLGRKADVDYVDNNLDKLAYFFDLTDNTYWAYYDIYEAANDHIGVYDDEINETWFDF